MCVCVCAWVGVFCARSCCVCARSSLARTSDLLFVMADLHRLPPDETARLAPTPLSLSLSLALFSSRPQWLVSVSISPLRLHVLALAAAAALRGRVPLGGETASSVSMDGRLPMELWRKIMSARERESDSHRSLRLLLTPLTSLSLSLSLSVPPVLSGSLTLL